MDNREIKDTLLAAELYISSLKELDSEIEKAEEQIQISASETENNITTVFACVLENLSTLLNERRTSLLQKAKQIRDEGLTPLEESRRIISDKIESANNLINIGKHILQGDTKNNSDFTSKTSLLGSLPQVPELKEVPFLTFQYDQNAQSELQELCSQFGTVHRIAPIQISQMTEKPGAILVEWESVDLEDRMTDIQEFILQRAFGDVINNKHLVVNFMDCYKGPETQFLVKDLQTSQPYSFRVQCKFEGCPNWSPWSVIQVMSTTIKPYSWADNKDFSLFNENRIAKSIKDHPSILYSEGPQFHVGYSIEFTFLEIDSKSSLVGLIYTDCLTKIKDLKSDTSHSFLIDQTGTIFVDGTNRATHLPELTKGTKVVFTCELISEDKVRMNIDSCNKRVTYDWCIPKESELYFSALFESKDSKILVE